MPISAGETVLASEYGEHPRCIARGRRTTNGTAVSAVTGFLRLDDIPIIGGRSYEIVTNGIPVDPSVTTTVWRCEVRYTTDGSTPTASSANLPGAWIRGVGGNIADGPIQAISGDYHPTSDETLSVILCVAASGGTAQILADPTFPVSIWVKDMGEDPGDTGVDI